MVLALKPNRIRQVFLPCPVRALFCDFAPGFVLHGPGHVAVVVGQFQPGAEVVALVPGQGVKQLRLGPMGPQRALVDVVGALVGWLLA